MLEETTIFIIITIVTVSFSAIISVKSSDTYFCLSSLISWIKLVFTHLLRMFKKDCIMYSQILKTFVSQRQASHERKAQLLLCWIFHKLFFCKKWLPMVKIFSTKTRNFTYPKWNQDKDLEFLYEVVKLEFKPLNCILRKIFFSTWSDSQWSI